MRFGWRENEESERASEAKEGEERRPCSGGRRCGDGVSPLFRGPAALPPGQPCPPRPAWTPSAPAERKRGGDVVVADGAEMVLRRSF